MSEPPILERLPTPVEPPIAPIAKPTVDQELATKRRAGGAGQGAISGAVGGAVVGTIIAPVLGTILGAVVGSILGANVHNEKNDFFSELARVLGLDEVKKP